MTAPAAGAREPVIDVRDLRVVFSTEEGLVRAVDGISFAVAAGEVLGVVGESGSGKTVTAQTVIGLNRRERNVTFSGRVLYKGRDLLPLPESEMRHVRGREISMVLPGPDDVAEPGAADRRADRGDARPSTPRSTRSRSAAG